MPKLKEKVQIFVKENKILLVVGGIALTTIAYQNHIDKIHKAALKEGAIYGFWKCLEWGDNNLDNIPLKQLWIDWSNVNPNKRVM
jgi:hypothetical protein